MDARVQQSCGWVGEDDDRPAPVVRRYFCGKLSVDSRKDRPMLTDPEVFEILEQARRNLDSLEQLARTSSDASPGAIESLRRRLHDLKSAYTNETNALTRVVLKRAVERRVGVDRRQSVTAHQ